MNRVIRFLSQSFSIRSSRACLLLPHNLLSNMMATSITSSASQFLFLGLKSSIRMEVGWIAKCCSSYYSTMTQNQMEDQRILRSMTSSEVYIDDQAMYHQSRSDVGNVRKHQLGENVSRKDKVKFLVDTLLDLKESKEDVYGALDAWVAWEPNFPIASLKRALITLEKEQQWHRVIQVIKWMLSKGQGTTMGTYGQLIRALDMDQRAEEAHNIWAKKIGYDLHSVSWQLCKLMISIYYRNNMLERLVKLFKGLEAFDRKPPEKSVVQKVANAYELLGLPEDQKRVLEKYNSLFTETWNRHRKTSKKASKKKAEKSGEKNSTETSSDIHTSIVDNV